MRQRSVFALAKIFHLPYCCKFQDIILCLQFYILYILIYSTNTYILAHFKTLVGLFFFFFKINYSHSVSL